MNFMPLIVAAFSHHAAYQVTIIRNMLFVILLSALIYWIDKFFFAISILHLLQGFLLGSLVSWKHYDGIRVRFYSRTTNESARKHFCKQLSKLVYPHQLEMIKQREELERTRPIKEGRAIFSAFDVQRITEIKHGKTQEFL
tara:strand:+ start:240 stop:662 length:423 start_codon:yes stop_codon:yes gene_type:complete